MSSLLPCGSSIRRYCIHICHRRKQSRGACADPISPVMHSRRIHIAKGVKHRRVSMKRCTRSIARTRRTLDERAPSWHLSCTPHQNSSFWFGWSWIRFGSDGLYCPLFCLGAQSHQVSARLQQTHLIPQSEASSDATGRSPSYQSSKTPRSDENCQAVL